MYQQRMSTILVNFSKYAHCWGKKITIKFTLYQTNSNSCCSCDRGKGKVRKCRSDMGRYWAKRDSSNLKLCTDLLPPDADVLAVLPPPDDVGRGVARGLALQGHVFALPHHHRGRTRWGYPRRYWQSDMLFKILLFCDYNSFYYYMYVCSMLHVLPS